MVHVGLFVAAAGRVEEVRPDPEYSGMGDRDAANPRTRDHCARCERAANRCATNSPSVQECPHGQQMAVCHFTTAHAIVTPVSKRQAPDAARNRLGDAAIEAMRAK
jgi:hypothetical protein